MSDASKLMAVLHITSQQKATSDTARNEKTGKKRRKKEENREKAGEFLLVQVRAIDGLTTLRPVVTRLHLLYTTKKVTNDETE